MWLGVEDAKNLLPDIQKAIKFVVSVIKSHIKGVTLAANINGRNC